MAAAAMLATAGGCFSVSNTDLIGRVRPQAAFDLAVIGNRVLTIARGNVKLIEPRATADDSDGGYRGRRGAMHPPSLGARCL
jgi:hypothetical protein